MSFVDCIKAAIKKGGTGGGLTAKQANDLIKDYEDTLARYQENMPVDEAIKAADKYIQVKQDQIVTENRAKVIHAVYSQKIPEKINMELARRQKAYDAMNKAQQKLERKPSIHHIIGDMYEDVFTRQKSLARRMEIRLVDFANKHGSKMAGFVQDVEGLPKVMKGILGEDSGDPTANSFGKEIRGVFDDLHEMYRQAGGLIGKLPNYFPQTHNPVKIKEVSFDQWQADILPLLDRERMIDLDTGLPMEDRRLFQQMRDDYKAIVTNGMSELQKRLDEGLVTTGRGGDVFKRNQQSRFYHFKDADSFLNYNNKYGEGDVGIYNAVWGHINSMSRDIALMQKMGAKPNAIARQLDTEMIAKGVGINGRTTVNGMYDLASGLLSDYSAQSMPVRMLQGLKGLTRFFLGAAAISAVADTAFVRMAMKMNGLNSWKTTKRYLNGLNPADPVTQREMQRFTAIMSSVNGASLQGARYMDDVRYDGGKVVQGINFLSNAIIRASGLGKMTDQGKMAVMSTAMGDFAEFKTGNKSFDELNPKIRKLMARYDLGKEEYDILKQAELFTEEQSGATFLTPQDVLKVKGDKEQILNIASSYDDMITHLGEVAVNEPNLRTRSITTGAALGKATSGTWLRELSGAIGTFKSFPITVLTNFIFPLARSAASGNRQDILNFGEVAALTTILGGLALQAKDISKGKTTRDMDDPKFWMAAAMQGGGLGIFGDFVFADYSRFGQSVAETMAGPVVGTLGDAFRVINGNFNRAIDDKLESNFMADTFDLAKGFIPFSTLWYARLPIERIFIDSVDQVLDPEFSKKARAREKRMKTNYGQTYYWDEGELLPDF